MKILNICVVVVLAGCASKKPPSADENMCTQQWYASVENRLNTGDNQGHGPDLGSSEWQSVIEFKLGVRGDPRVPDRSGNAWCAYVEGLIQEAKYSD